MNVTQVDRGENTEWNIRWYFDVLRESFLYKWIYKD
jgi:hypothetical protein